MPYRKTQYRKKRPMKKRRQYRKKRYNRAIARPTRNFIQGAGFPDRMFVKLKYVAQTAVSSGSYYNYIFRGNSVFAPDYTAGVNGHQPLYYDQYSAIYGRYRVYACKQLVYVTNNSTTVSCNVTVLHSTDSTGITSTSKILEQTGSAVTRNIGPLGSNNTATLKYFVKTSQAFGLNSKEIGDDAYAPYVGYNPGQPYYIHSHIEATDGVSATNVSLMYRLTYYVEFFDRKDIAQS